MGAYIKVNGVTLDVPYYVQPERRGGSWASMLVSAATALPRRRFARILDGISFEINEGERVALFGRNGAGKTTLLRVLSGAFQPTSGGLEVVGSRQALLNLGVGFNQEGTLLENIYLRATAMGLQAKVIKGLVDSILEFAELEHLANRRLLTLSAGQRMRLGFAISTAVQHDIMLLDEWFGAGDFSFVKKARERLVDRMNGSKIVVVASHNTELAKKLCNRALVMDGGRLVYSGDVKDALAFYKSLGEGKQQQAQPAG